MAVGKVLLTEDVESGVYQMHPHTLLRFEVQVAEHCNLNCRDCLHFSPLAEKEFLDIDEYQRDCAQLSKLFDAEAEYIYLVGGEPLLHPNLIEIMRITREAFSYGRIAIITNGILLPSLGESFWTACKEYRIEILPTKYPISLDYSGIEEQIKQKDVMCHPFADAMPYMLRTPLSLKGDQPVEETFYSCNHSNNCVTLRHGKLYTCEIAAHAHHLKKYFNLDISLSQRNGVDIYTVQSAEELMEKLTRPIPFCRYCRLDNRDFWENWSVSQKDRYEWIQFEWSEEDIRYLRNAADVYVYGAGAFGRQTVSRLLEHGINVKAILVNSRENTPIALLDVPIVETSTVKIVAKDSVCLLAAGSTDQTKLERTLRKKGCGEVVLLSDFRLDELSLRRLRAVSEVYLYGAGRRAREMIPQLQQKGITVTKIFVTNMEGNPVELLGIPVAVIQSVRTLPEDSVCIVAIDHYTAKSEMQNSAYQVGFKKLIPLMETDGSRAES